MADQFSAGTGGAVGASAEAGEVLSCPVNAPIYHYISYSQANPLDSGGPYLVKLKGLPYDATKPVIAQFLSDCAIKDGNEGIHILLGADCRASGEALVALSSHMDMVKALNHDRNHIGNRYVEVMYVTQEQFDEDVKATSNAVSEWCKVGWALIRMVVGLVSGKLGYVFYAFKWV